MKCTYLLPIEDGSLPGQRCRSPTRVGLDLQDGNWFRSTLLYVFGVKLSTCPSTESSGGDRGDEQGLLWRKYIWWRRLVLHARSFRSRPHYCLSCGQHLVQRDVTKCPCKIGVNVCDVKSNVRTAPALRGTKSQALDNLLLIVLLRKDISDYIAEQHDQKERMQPIRPVFLPLNPSCWSC